MNIWYLSIKEDIEINKRMIFMYSEKERIGVKVDFFHVSSNEFTILIQVKYY